MTNLSDEKLRLIQAVLNPGLSPDERRDLRQEIPGPEVWLAESVVDLEAHPERLALVQEMGRDYYDPAAIADFLLSWPRPLPDEEDEFRSRIAIQDLLVLNPGIEDVISVDAHAEEASSGRLGDHFLLGALLYNPTYQEFTTDLLQRDDAFESRAAFESAWHTLSSVIINQITEAYPRKSWSVLDKSKSAAQRAGHKMTAHIFENWEKMIATEARGKYPKEAYSSMRILDENKFRTARDILEFIMTAMIFDEPISDFESIAKSYNAILVFSKSFLAEFGLSLTKHPLQEIF